MARRDALLVAALAALVTAAGVFSWIMRNGCADCGNDDFRPPSIELRVVNLTAQAETLEVTFVSRVAHFDDLQLQVDGANVTWHAERPPGTPLGGRTPPLARDLVVVAASQGTLRIVGVDCRCVVATYALG
ncbi:MAG: hypothetical protein QOE90_167 [Thermoplasmata archaeon]|jgi:hypothetical protein|nr:hypothetical protein [Thermoplasmata archaeon]